MSDTPETDASCGYALSSHYGRLEGSYLQMDWSGPFVHAEVARKLERERDEAREKAERYRLEANSLMLQRDEARESLKHIGEYGTEEINAAIDLRQKLASALVERDEARSELSLKQQTLTIAEGTLSDLRKQRDEWAAMCGRYKQERDEALMDRANGDIATMTRNHYERILRERDEWKNKAYSHATDYTLMEAKCFRLEQQLKEYDKLKS